MATTLKITGSDRGYYVEVLGKALYAEGAVGKRMDGTVGLCWSGTFLPPAADMARVEAVIAEVVASGVEQVITIGEQVITIGQSATPEARSPEWRSRRGLTLTEEMDREDSIY